MNHDAGTLTEHARALVTATAGAAEEKVNEARERVTAALESGKEIYARARDKAIRGARVADVALHEHPYRAVGVALGVGALIGFLVARRRSSDQD